jgi:hypothetical protein
MKYTKKKGACKWLTPPQKNRTKKQEGSHKTSEAGIEVEVPKQKSCNKQIVSHQIGVVTREHELAIENYLQNREYHLVCFFTSYKKQQSLKQKIGRFQRGNR